MASRKEGSFLKEHPKIKGGLAATLLLIAGVMCISSIRALELGIDIFAPTPGEVTPEPLFPGTALPDQNPSDNEPEAKPAVKP